MHKTLSQIIALIGRWLLRPRSAGVAAMRIGLACVVVALGAGWALDLSIPVKGGKFDLTINSGGGTPQTLIYIISILGAFLMTGGFTFELIKYAFEAIQNSSRKVNVIEVRGLRDGAGVPLSGSLPASISGHRNEIIIDLRQAIVDGRIVDPSAAMNRLMALRHDLDRYEAAMNRNDLATVYGGLAPVPLTFLTGILLDDEEDITVLDWDRHKRRWRTLEEEDDLKRFNVSGIESLAPAPSDVALLVSVSYAVKAEDVELKLGAAVPQVMLTLEDGGFNAHWSLGKQIDLGRQFLETILAISNKGAKQIHIFLSAPNSLVFRFGSLYDKKNLPGTIVYHYQYGENPPFTWGISMPVAGKSTPGIV